MRLFGQQLQYQFRHRRRQIGIQLTRRLRVLRCHRHQHGHRILARERLRSGRHLVHHAAQAEQIAPGIDRLAFDLLGGHVRRRPHDEAGIRQLGPLAADLHQSEIENLGTNGRRRAARGGRRERAAANAPLFAPFAARLQKNVRRLDVAMNQAVLVCRDQPTADLDAQAQQLGHAGPAAMPQPAIERFAAQEFRREVGNILVYADLMNGNDVIALQRRHHARFTQKALARHRVLRDLRLHDLERHQPLQLGVQRFEDDPHSPLSDNAQHLIVCQPTELIRRPRRRKERISLLLRFAWPGRQRVAILRLVPGGDFLLALESRQHRPAADFRLGIVRRRIGRQQLSALDTTNRRAAQ